MVAEAFHPTERLGEREQLGALAEATGGSETSLDPDRYDAAEAVHLARGQRVLRMRRQTRMDDLVDRRMRREEFGQRLCIFAMRAHAQVQRLQSAQREEAVERALDRADRVLQESELLGQLRVVADDDHAADDVGMAIEVFGCRMHHEIRAMFQLALQ